VVEWKLHQCRVHALRQQERHRQDLRQILFARPELTPGEPRDRADNVGTVTALDTSMCTVSAHTGAPTRARPVTPGGRRGGKTSSRFLRWVAVDTSMCTVSAHTGAPTRARGR
jgi:hypothetical protein